MHLINRRIGREWVLCLLSILFLASCGGGSGSDTPGPPKIAAAAPPTGATGVDYGYTFKVESGGVAPFTWSASGAMPPGLGLDSAGHLSGTPSVAGHYALTVLVTDLTTHSASLAVNLTIADSPMVIDTSAAPPAGVVTNVYAGYSFGVSSGGSAPFSWAVTSGALPGGLSLAADGTLSGTPTAAGSFNFTVTATDAAQPAETSSQSFAILVTPPDPLALAPGQVPPPGVHGTPYAFTFGVTGGYLPLSWTVTAGALPPGLALGSDGTVSGTPTVASPTPYAFTLAVTDTSTPTPVASSAPYSIAVSEPPPPTIASTPPPTAIVGSSYNFQFYANDGLAPLIWIPPTDPMGGLAIDINGALSGTPTAAGMFPISLTVKDALLQTSPPTPFTVRVALARPAAQFTATRDMTAARTGHTATLLADGRVLIAGGGPAFAELFDPVTHMFSRSAQLMVTLGRRSATLLADAALPNHGKVLFVGGNTLVAELFDPTSGTVATTGSMLSLHLGQTATLLQSGKVLVAGGETTSAELFDPSTGTFTPTGSLTLSRAGHTATLLPNGRVLITGGAQVTPGTWPIPCCGEVSAEIYDPVAGTFSTTGSMSEGRYGHNATLLDDGTVLITGSDGVAEVFSSATGTFTVVGSVPSTAAGATATLRRDGTVLVAGGNAYLTIGAASLFAPECQGFVPTGSLVTARGGHTATLLADGTVLVAGGTRLACGGYGGRGCHHVPFTLVSAEIFH